jgi:hypothetical protein
LRANSGCAANSLARLDCSSVCEAAFLRSGLHVLLESLPGLIVPVQVSQSDAVFVDTIRRTRLQLQGRLKLAVGILKRLFEDPVAAVGKTNIARQVVHFGLIFGAGYVFQQQGCLGARGWIILQLFC